MPGLQWLDNSVFEGWWIIFWFILFAGCVVFMAKFLTMTLESLTDKIKISKIFMGGVVMSLVTSFPELVGSIYGAINQDPLFSIYNETGSNSIQIFLLSITMVCFFFINFCKSKKNHNKKTIGEIYDNCLVKMDKENKVLIYLLLVFYFIFIFFALVPDVGKYLYIPGWNISIISIIPFVFWVGFIIWTLCKKTNVRAPAEKQNFFHRFNKSLLWLFFILFSVGLVWFSFVNSGIVDKMSGIYNIPTQSAASILLSIPSALPETLTMIFLFKNKQYSMGFSALVGSGLTNSSFMFYVDSIYREPIFKELYTSYLNSDNHDLYLSAIRMQYWIPIILVIYGILALTSIKKIARSNTFSTINLSAISIVYIVGFTLISTLVN